MISATNHRQERALREKELRIALVCSGGVSLAVYMHGITKEILKLVRASSALHRIADRALRPKASFLDQVKRDDREYDTVSAIRLNPQRRKACVHGQLHVDQASAGAPKAASRAETSARHRCER